jgi:hypothetical protein
MDNNNVNNENFDINPNVIDCDSNKTNHNDVLNDDKQQDNKDDVNTMICDKNLLNNDTNNINNINNNN